MNWRPASPFDACLANELVMLCCKFSPMCATITVAKHAHEIPLLYWQREYAEAGLEVMRAHAESDQWR